jgi:DNA-binding transcriptional MocR family regulator
VEDDAASELVYSGAKYLPLKASDTQNNIIYIYSFSLTFLPGLSLAVVVADKELIRSLSYLVSVRLVATDWMTQKLIAGYLDDGRYYQHLHEFRNNYAVKQEIMCRELDKMKPLGMEYVRPRGGVYLWCHLPEGIDSMELELEARRNGVSIVPGYVFYPGKGGGRDFIRLNFSYENRERIQQGMKLLREVIETQLAPKK